jgi:hypothetical protein
MIHLDASYFRQFQDATPLAADASVCNLILALNPKSPSNALAPNPMDPPSTNPQYSAPHDYNDIIAFVLFNLTTPLLVDFRALLRPA